MRKYNFSNPTISIKFGVFTCLFLVFSNLYSQKSIAVKLIEHNDVKIDGVLDELDWEKTIPSSDFSEWFPADNKPVKHQTELRMMYSSQYLYIGIKAYAPGNKYITPSYERDYSISGADVINLMFDTYSDRVNAFLFGINQYGVLREGIISNGGVTGNLDLSWDTKWLGESVVHDGYCVFEIRIPMSSFKFKKDTKRWKFSSMRSDTQSNTFSSWSAVPQNQNQLNLGYFGDMIFEEPLEKSKNPISIIPYITPSYTENYIKDKSSFEFKAGADIKIPVKSSLMLDLTVNPDFSSEDVVPGENNTTRFEIKRDETRQFFIDNGDLFNGFGLEEDALAFYSRRVGVGEDADGNTSIVPIVAGVKFTGKLNKNLRIGVLDVQTAGDNTELIPNNNNLVLAAEHKILGKSNIGAFFINRQATNSGEPYIGTESNRVAGTDFRYFSEDNTFDAHVYLHKSMTPNVTGNQISTGTDINLEKRAFTLKFTGQYVDDGYQSDLGYIKRKDIVRAHPFFEYKFYPETDVINTLKLKVSNNRYWLVSQDMRLGDSDLLFGSYLNFTNGAAIGLEFANRYSYLSNPFNPVSYSTQQEENGALPLNDIRQYFSIFNNAVDSSSKGDPIPVGGYHTNDLKLTYNTNRRKEFWAEGYTKYGGFYLGTKFTSEITFQYRQQPIFFINLKIQYDNIVQPEPYSSGELWYAGPTFNFTFTKSLFWNTDMQYSTQTNSFFINSRLQWRYAPLSDIFLTYTDNYSTNPLLALDRGLYLKMTYWFDVK